MFSNPFKKKNEKAWPSSEAASAAFLADPNKCLFGCNLSEYRWADDMVFSFNRRQIAYVCGITFDSPSVVRINQIAVENDMLRRGIGQVLVAWLVRELAMRGNVEIRFNQGNDTSYPAFFKKLGAVAEQDPLRTDRNWPIWVLPCSASSK